MTVLDTKRMSVISLALANVVPMAGAIFFGWEVFDILLLYWFETAIIGVYFIGKLFVIVSHSAIPQIGSKHPATALIQPGSPVRTVGGLLAAGFFIMHYGGFMTVHLVFLFAMFGPPLMSGVTGFFSLDILLQGIGTVGLGIAALAVSHGISFIRNFVQQQEFTKTTLRQVLFMPYQRIIIMHLTLIASAFVVSYFDEPLFGLLIMIVLKIITDIYSHLREHARYTDNTNRDIQTSQTG